MNKLTENLKNADMRNKLQQRYTAARMNLLLVVIFTAINIAMLLAKNFTYFLFSASIPYFLVDLGMLYCGLYPPEWYIEMELVGMEFFETELLIILVSVAAVILLIYLLCFFLSRNMNYGWLIAAAVMFGIDTVAMFLLTGTSGIMDIIFHAWVMYYLIFGITAVGKIKALPTEQDTAEEMLVVGENGERYDSTPLRAADMTVKSRTLLASDVLGHSVVYRRVKKTNELVIDGKVYDEYVALMEFPHTLVAVIDGHVIQAGCDNSSRIFISLDGNILAKKLRII